LGIATHRDSVVYDFDRTALIDRVKEFVDAYNGEVDRYRRAGSKADVDAFVHYEKIVWDRDLKKDLVRGRYAEFDEAKLRIGLYRPFTKRCLFFDKLVNAEVYTFPKFFPTVKTEAENCVIALSQIGYRAAHFSCLVAENIADLHLCASLDGHQCFPFYLYDEDGTNRRENITDWALEQFRTRYNNKKIGKWEVFYYVYGVLHHPDYRTKFADNLKRELPRIPFAPDFAAFAKAGQELARLHLDYEKLEPYPLK